MEIKIVNFVEVIVIIMYLCVNLETVNVFTLTSSNNINGSFCPGKIIFNWAMVKRFQLCFIGLSMELKLVLIFFEMQI